MSEEKCKCTLRESMLGDGCKVCQPLTYIAHLEDALKSAESDIAQLEADLASQQKDHIPNVGQMVQSQAHQTESQWISVEERLPEGYKPVLVVTNFGDVYTCRLPVIIAKNSKEESSVGKRERFTHWMPLPPAPEGEKP